jgi:pimeloyl-ACP methyl ester carboxylesterase
MATKLHGVRPDASLTWLEDIGHYPMLESPSAFLDAVAPALA